MRKILSLMISVLFAGSLIADTYYSKALNEIASTDVVLITAQNADGEVYALSNDQGTSAAPKAVAVTLSAGAVSTEASNIQWNVGSFSDENGDTHYVFYPNGETEKWLYCTNSNNGVRVGESETNAFSIEATSGYLFNNSTSRYLGVYNKQDWRCYTSVNSNIKGQTLAFYVLDASSVSKDVYTVTGAPAALFGTTWDPTLTSNDMQKNAAGLYVWSKEQAALAAGDVSFKVVTNHDWANASYPSENYVFKVEKDGTYDVTIWFDPSSKSITPVLVGDTISCSTAILLAEKSYAKDVVIKGYVTELIGSWNSEYSNVSFWMADEANGGQQFEAYRVACASAEDAPAVGDLVWVKAPVKMYGKIAETNGGNFGILKAVVPVETTTLYFVNQAEWSAVNAYAFKDGNTVNAEWPGLAMTKLETAWNGYDVYSYECPSDLVTIIFNNGSSGAGNQTANLTWSADAPYFSAEAKNDQGYHNAKWYASLDVIPAPVETVKYYLAGTMNKWGVNSDYQFTKVGNGEYSLDVTLAVDDEFKVIAYEDGEITKWYGNSNITVDANYAGEKTIYFRPAGNSPEWTLLDGYIWMEKNPAEITDCASAQKAVLAGEHDATKTYELQGYVTSIVTAYNSQFNNITFWMADAKDGGQVLEAYRCKVAEGEEVPSVGDLVKVSGKLTKYTDNSGASIAEFASGCSVVMIQKDVPAVNLGKKTIAEFLKLKNAKDTCILTGIVANISNTTYGNLDLVELGNEDVKVYVYGVLTPEGQNKQFASLDVAEGDTLTVKAIYGEKNGAAQIPDAIFISRAKYVAPAAIYTVAGSEESIFGKAWDPTITANDMESAGDGIYMWIKEDLVLSAGSIELKVVKNHAWEESWPSSNNYTVTVEAAAKYTIAVQFNPQKGELEAWLTKTGDVQPEEPMTVYLINMENWWNANAYVWYGEGNDAVAKAPWPGEIMTLLEEKFEGKQIYSFSFPKEYVNIIFTGEGRSGSGLVQTIDLTWSADKPYYLMDAEDDNGKFHGKWYASLNDIPTGDDPEPEMYTVVGNSVTLFGTTWDPTLADNDMKYDEENKGYVWYREGVELGATDIEIKVVKNHAWANGSWPADDAAGNVVNYILKIEKDGKYDISILFNAETKGIQSSAVLSEEPVVNEWAEIVFTNEAEKGTLDGATFAAPANENFKLTVTDTDSKIAIDANIANFGTFDSYFEYNYRLKTGGKSSAKNALTLAIPADGLLRVAVRPGNNDATDRTLVIKQDGEELYNRVVQESDASALTEYNTAGELVSKNIYPYRDVNVKAGTVNIEYPIGGLNFYSFGFKKVEQPVQKTTTFIVNVPEGTENVYIAGSHNGWTFDKMEAAPTALNQFEITYDADYSDAAYKYCAGPDWAYVEVNENGSDANNRTFLAGAVDEVPRWKAVPSATSSANFYITGNAALTAALGLSDEMEWAPNAYAVEEESAVLSLPAGIYRMKITTDGTWNTAKGYLDLSERPLGLQKINNSNIGFTLAAPGRVQVTYAETEDGPIFKVAGSYIPTPIVAIFMATGDGWEEDNESNAIYDAETESITVSIAKAKVAQWQAQVHMQGPVAKDGKLYDVSMKMLSNKAVQGITMKYQNDVEMVYENQSVALEANTEYTYAKSDIAGKAGDGICVLDFGKAEAGTVIKIYGINIVEKEPAAEQHIYSVAGSANLLGSNWNEAEGNEMELQNEGGYKLVKENVVLGIGRYEYKVVIDHQWNNGEAADNSILSIEKDGKYNVTFTYNAETKETNATAEFIEPAVIEDVYTVVGGLALTGENWNPSATANDMKLGPTSGLYIWEKEDVVLTENTKLKVVLNHAWDVQYPSSSQDYILEIAAVAKYKVTVYFNAETKTVTAEAVKTGDAVIPNPVVSIAGAMNNWNASADKMTPTADELTASVKIEMQAGSYEFKAVFDAEKWMTGAGVDGKPYQFDRDNVSAGPININGGNGNNMVLVADIDGEYLFTWTFADSTLAITFPEKPVVEDIYTVVGNSVTLFGTTWDPTIADNDMKYDEENQGYVWYREEVELVAGMSIELKVVKNHAWANGSWPADDAAGNVVNYILTIEKDGKYNIGVFFKADTKGIQASAELVEQPVSEWDIIYFKEVDVADKGQTAKTFVSDTNAEFILSVTDTDSKIAIDANDARFGDPILYSMYNYRLKTGGKSSAKNALTLAIPADGQLQIAVRTGKNDATDRNLVLKQGDVELYNQVVQESNAEAVMEGEVEVKVYPYIIVDVKAGAVNIEYPVNGLNFYSFGFKKVEQPVQKTTTFIVNVPEGTENVYIAGSHNGWTFDKMEAAPTALNQFEITYDADYSDAAYKYCAGPDWAYVEMAAENVDANNRTYKAGVIDEVALWKAVPGAIIDNGPIIDTYFASGDQWYPDNESSATWDSESEKVTVNIVQAKQAQWQAQVKYQGPEAKVGKLYDLSFKMKANKAVNDVTVKWQDNAPMVDQQIDLEAGVEYAFAKKDMDGILGDGVLVFDFGFAPAGTVVEIYDVVFTEKEMPVEDVTVYFVNDEAWETVKAYIWDAEGTSYKAWGESDAMTKTTAQVAGMDVYSYTYSSVYLNIIFHNGVDKQTINLMRDREKPYCYREQWFASLNEIQALVDKGPFEAWFTGPDNWDGETQSNLVYEATTGKATVNILVDKNAQWKAQVKYHGKKAQEGMLYDLSLKMKANKAVSGITLKYQNNVPMLYENQTLALEANVELAYAKSDLEGMSGDGVMVLDFGYATAGTVIEIYDVAIIEKEKPFVPADSYSLAGDLEALFGTAWNPESTANDMVRDQSAEGFIYKYQKTGVEIHAKQIAFKIVENHSWAAAYPSDNYILPIREEGIYTIDVIFNAETKAIEATATKTGNVGPYVPTIPNGYYLVGNMTNWQVVAEAKYLFSAAPEAGVYNLVYTLKDGDMFKVVEMYNDAATWLPGSVSGDDRNFNVTAAYAGEKTILFRPDGEGGEGWHAGYIFVEKNSEAPMPKFYIAGSFTNWAEGMIPVYEDSYEIAFDKADTYYMKVVTVDEAGQHWYGHSDLAEKDKFLGDPEGNIWLQISISSFVPNPKVQVAFDAETKKITVTGNCMKLQKPVTDGYYLFSAMTAVYVLAGQIPENFKFVENEAVPGEYSATAILLEGDSFVAVLIQGNQILQYYPGATSVSVDGIHAGAEKTVYFRTTANEAWKSFHESGLFWIDENPAPEEPVVRLYVLVDVNIKWKKIYAYAWKNVIENEIQKQIPYKAWPGIEMGLFAPTAGSNAPARVMMKQVDETSYIFDCPKSYDNIIFTDGTEQTADQVWKEDKPVFVLSAEKDSEGLNKGEWKADAPTDIENIELDSNIEKLMLNGEIYILKNGKIYNVTGQLVR